MSLDVPVDRSEALAERLFASTIGALELHSIYLGAELGLYAALERHGALTHGELARHAGIHERYAREWLEQQAVAGLLSVDAPDDDAAARRYRLDPDHARVLAHPDDAAHAAPFAHMLVGVGAVMARVAEAYRSGGGVPYEAYGYEFRHGQGHANRPAFTHDLPHKWIPAMPDVVERLRSGEARVADIGMGQGWSTIAIARAYPGARVDGLDLDPRSVEDARRHAAEADLGDRVVFRAGDAASLAADGPYDLVLILEALHDMTAPRAALAAVREALAPGGALLVVDERVQDAYTAPGDEVERFMYGWSVTHCLPTQMVDEPSAALGTVLRADTVRRLAAEAGYAGVEVLPVENDFFRMYRLNP